jgi:hypothetical protein
VEDLEPDIALSFFCAVTILLAFNVIPSDGVSTPIGGTLWHRDHTLSKKLVLYNTAVPNLQNCRKVYEEWHCRSQILQMRKWSSGFYFAMFTVGSFPGKLKLWSVTQIHFEQS